MAKRHTAILCDTIVLSNPEVVVPKIVDRDERRRAMADAILDIAARDGLGSVTVGSVAAEMCLSKGAVQHYFSSKNDMLTCAARALHDRIGSRVRASGGDGGDELESMLVALLPLTEHDRRDAAAGHALFSVALSDPDLRALYLRGRDIARSAVAELMIGRTVDTEAAAREVLALVGDLGDSILLGELDYAAARDIIRARCRAG
ncbi:TetR/AcrR family transcriptional regulator [Actinomycetes bacterium M1A6_2h]